MDSLNNIKLYIYFDYLMHGLEASKLHDFLYGSSLKVVDHISLDH